MSEFTRFWVVITFLTVLLVGIVLFKTDNRVLKEPAERVGDSQVTVYHITGKMGAVGDIDIYITPEGGKQ